MFGRLLMGGGLGAHHALWLAFALPVLVLLVVDFGLFLKNKREPTLKESLGWTAIWAAVAAVFGIGLTAKLGPTEGLAFFTSYIVEQALSVDNLFVFMLVFAELAVPAGARKRALAYGVLGALVLRVAMLAAGGAFLSHFHALGWLLGALLIAMGVKAAFKLRKDAEDSDEKPTDNVAARTLGRFLPVHDRFDGDRFTTEVGGRSFATPLLVAVVTILFADIVFALDSIPAVLGVSTNPIIVVTSNVFAVLGLRAMFFVVSGLLARLKYLPHGLAAVLVVVGAKMLLGAVLAIPTWLSLASVLGVLSVAVVFSLRAPVGALNESKENKSC
jgi:tellurite resistance protein TerC